MIKEFIRDNQALTYILSISVSVIGYIGAGFLLAQAQTMAVVPSFTVLMILLGLVAGTIFVVVPLTYLYELYMDMTRNYYRVHDRLMDNQTQNTTPRRGTPEGQHWQTDQPPLDDIDGDGQDNDSLRRLGVLR